MAEVTMSLEEYNALVSGQGPIPLGGRPGRLVPKGKGVRQPKKRKGKKDPKMARALTKANEMGRKKSGGFKKGWSQGKIMSKAHELKRKMR